MHFSPTVALILGILGGVAEIVQEVAITMSAQAHSIIAFGIVVLLSFGVVPLSAEALRRLIPAHVAAILTAAAGILAAAQQTFGVSGTVHSIILFVLALFAAVGIVPAVLKPPAVKQALVSSGKVAASVISSFAVLAFAALTLLLMLALVVV